MALPLFDTELSVSSTLPDNIELSLALGFKTIVHWTATQSLTFVGLSLTGSVVPVDGMVVAFSNLNNNTFLQNFAHESGLATNTSFRFRNAGLAAVNGGTGAGCVWYRYNAALLRWIQVNAT